MMKSYIQMLKIQLSSEILKAFMIRCKRSLLIDRIVNCKNVFIILLDRSAICMHA